MYLYYHCLHKFEWFPTDFSLQLFFIYIFYDSTQQYVFSFYFQGNPLCNIGDIIDIVILAIIPGFKCQLLHVKCIPTTWSSHHYFEFDGEFTPTSKEAGSTCFQWEQAKILTLKLQRALMLWNISKFEQARWSLITFKGWVVVSWESVTWKSLIRIKTQWTTSLTTGFSVFSSLHPSFFPMR